MARIPEWPRINPSELRHQVQIQSESSTPDSFGQPQPVWTTILTAWASVETINEKELYQAGALTSQVTHTITIRYPGSSVTIAPGMRVVYGSHTYKLQACNNVDERNILLKLMCLELNGAQ